MRRFGANRLRPGLLLAALLTVAQAPAPQPLVPQPLALQPPAAAQSPADAPPATPALPAVPPEPAWIPRPGAELRALDKVSAVPTTLRLRTGASVSYGSLTITLVRCMVRPPDQPEDAAAFVDVQDSHAGEPGFHGWMFAREPELGVFEHPVYDLRLIGCTE